MARDSRCDVVNEYHASGTSCSKRQHASAESQRGIFRPSLSLLTVVASSDRSEPFLSRRIPQLSSQYPPPLRVQLTCNFTLRSPTMIVLLANSTPIVCGELVFTESNQPRPLSNGAITRHTRLIDKVIQQTRLACPSLTYTCELCLAASMGQGSPTTINLNRKSNDVSARPDLPDGCSLTVSLDELCRVVLHCV